MEENVKKESIFVELGKKIGTLVTEKNIVYGDSFSKSGEILKILFSDGIKPEQYMDALAITRIIDKLFRIATSKDALGENPYQDIAGYALLGVWRGLKEKKLKKENE